MIKRQSWSCLAALALLAVASGCGGAPAGPTRFEMSGKVSFAGKPVPKGSVIFSPDADKGNSGPGTTARIVDGQYKTEPGMGTIGGPHTVQISGYDGKPNVDSEDGTPLFPQYRTSAELPKASGTMDFEVKSESPP